MPVCIRQLRHVKVKSLTSPYLFIFLSQKKKKGSRLQFLRLHFQSRETLMLTEPLLFSASHCSLLYASWVFIFSNLFFGQTQCWF